MRAIEFIIEGYKEVTAKFNQTNDPNEVTNLINQYKDLVNKNQVSGNERNIDWWGKQGYDKFKSFVATKALQPTQTQVKTKALPGKSITIKENDRWLIVVPLDKDASCFHGKDSDWCTTKVNQSYFEEYFYNNKVTLIYCLEKQTGAMWAIAAHHDSDQFEMFDQRDKSLSRAAFKQQTGLEPGRLRNLALHEFHQDKVEYSRAEWEMAKQKLEKLLPRISGEQREPEIEKLILYIKDSMYAARYIDKIYRNLGKQDYPANMVLLAVKDSPNTINKVKSLPESLILGILRVNGKILEGFIDMGISITRKMILTAAANSPSDVIMILMEHDIPIDNEIQVTAFSKHGDAISRLLYKDILPTSDGIQAAIKSAPHLKQFILDKVEHIKADQR